jgi:hypothetical protein
MRKFLFVYAFALVILAVIVQQTIGGPSYASLPSTAPSGLAASPSAVPPNIYLSNKRGAEEYMHDIESARAEGITAIKGPVTEAGVRSYFADERNQSMMSHGQNVKIISVQFLTNQQVISILKDSYLSQYPMDIPLVYVTMTGNFQDDTPIMRTGYAVFDARTGNLLMSGAK